MVKQFDRSFQALENVFDFIDRFFGEYDVDERSAFALKLAIEEVFTNFVKYNSESDTRISVDLERNGDDVVAQIVDPDTSPFDMTQYDEADTSSQLDKRKAGGLGIFLVKKMVDDVQYHHADRTSTIVLTKKLIG